MEDMEKQQQGFHFCSSHHLSLAAHVSAFILSHIFQQQRLWPQYPTPKQNIHICMTEEPSAFPHQHTLMYKNLKRRRLFLLPTPRFPPCELWCFFDDVRARDVTNNEKSCFYIIVINDDFITVAIVITLHDLPLRYWALCWPSKITL